MLASFFPGYREARGAGNDGKSIRERSGLSASNLVYKLPILRTGVVGKTGDIERREWRDRKDFRPEAVVRVCSQVGQHLIELEVSDPQTKTATTQAVTVEPDQIYPVKPLRLKYKGISYFAGPVPPDWPGIPRPDKEEMDEQLDTIRHDLGCNAIIITAGEAYEDSQSQSFPCPPLCWSFR